MKEPLKAGDLVIVEGGYNLPDATAVTVKSSESYSGESKPDEPAADAQAKAEAKPSAGSKGDPP